MHLPTCKITTSIPSDTNMSMHICTDTIQNDTEANKNVTSDKSLLYNYEDIAPNPIGGVKEDDVAIVCTGKGFLQWLSNEGTCTLVEILYFIEVNGTIISPTTVVQQYVKTLQGFHTDANVDNGTGVLKLIHHDGISHITYHMRLENGLWFHQ